jgi:hypothetical protein
MVRLKIATAAKTDFGPDIFAAPHGFSEQRNNATGNRRVSDPIRRKDLRAKNQQNKATKIKSLPRSAPGPRSHATWRAAPSNNSKRSSVSAGAVELELHTHPPGALRSRSSSFTHC